MPNFVQFLEQQAGRPDDVGFFAGWWLDITRDTVSPVQRVHHITRAVDRIFQQVRDGEQSDLAVDVVIRAYHGFNLAVSEWERGLSD